MKSAVFLNYEYKCVDVVTGESAALRRHLSLIEIQQISFERNNIAKGGGAVKEVGATIKHVIEGSFDQQVS